MIEENTVTIENIPDYLDSAIATQSCQDFPGDLSKRLTLYVDPNTFVVVDNGSKLCGNWSTSPGNACSRSQRTYKLPRTGWSLIIEQPCSTYGTYWQVEFGLSEAMKKVFPLTKGSRCGQAGEGRIIKVRNRDETRSVEVDIEIDTIPDPTNQYPVTSTIQLHPGEIRELGCTEQNQASISFRLLDTRFI